MMLEVNGQRKRGRQKKTRKRKFKRVSRQFGWKWRKLQIAQDGEEWGRLLKK